VVTMTTQLQALGESARDLVDGYLRGHGTPGDGLLAAVARDADRRVTAITQRWQTVYREHGPVVMEQGVWLAGVNTLARALLLVQAGQASLWALTREAPAGLPPTDPVRVASDEGYTIWLAQAYAIEVDRMVVTVCLTGAVSDAD